MEKVLYKDTSPFPAYPESPATKEIRSKVVERTLPSYKWNCEIDCLAVVTRSPAGDEGKIVRCLEKRLPATASAEPRWYVDTPLLTSLGLYTSLIRDSRLRPATLEEIRAAGRAYDCDPPPLVEEIDPQLCLQF